MHRNTTRTTTHATGQELSDESRRMCLKMNMAKSKVVVIDNTPVHVNNVLIEHVEGYVLGTTLQPQGKEPGQRDTKKNHGRLGGIRQTPGYLQSNLAICLKRQVYNSCVLPARTYGAYMSTAQTSTEQACGRTDQDGKKYAQHNIQG